MDINGTWFLLLFINLSCVCKLSHACDLFRSIFSSVIENFSSFLFSFSHFLSFVHFCFLSVSEARSFLLYSKYKGRKILAIEFKHLHSKLFQINLVDFSLYISQKKFEFHSIFCKQDGAFLISSGDFSQY